MKAKLKSFFAGAAEVCSLDKSTFSAAMDVIVVERSDGSLYSTPFYIKFGRLKLMKSNKTRVILYVNNQQVQIEMELSKSGKAAFLRNDKEVSVNEEIKREMRNSDEEEKKLLETHTEIHSENLKCEKGYSYATLDMKFTEKNLITSPADSKQQSQDTVPKNELTSIELKMLKLRPGLNTVNYVTDTKKQLTLPGRIFLWEENCKIVVSDIDGTLTKSDMMGHLCYYIGKDWTRGGVVDLFRNIENRGYKILYLSSRSISQNESTLSLLDIVNQENQKLPLGPLLLNPNGMIKSILREISNNSHVFKTNTLKSVLKIFPDNKNPFFAGFGNRNGDSVAYNAIGMASKNVFIFASNKKKKSDDCSNIQCFTEISLNFDEIFLPVQ